MIQNTHHELQNYNPARAVDDATAATTATKCKGTAWGDAAGRGLGALRAKLGQPPMSAQFLRSIQGWT